MSSAASTLIITITCLAVCAWMNYDWYKICQKMNDSWFDRTKQIINDFTEITYSMNRRIYELEQKINEWSKKGQESTTHFEEDADKG